MSIEAKAILVCSPQYVSGGPEVLHQLVHTLRQIGHDAAIVYFPTAKDFQCPEPYRIYDAPQAQLIDDPDVLVVVPEVQTGILREITGRKEQFGGYRWTTIPI